MMLLTEAGIRCEMGSEQSTIAINAKDLDRQNVDRLQLAVMEQFSYLTSTITMDCW